MVVYVNICNSFTATCGIVIVIVLSTTIEMRLSGVGEGNMGGCPGWVRGPWGVVRGG